MSVNTAKYIVVTRPKHQSKDLINYIKSAGHIPICLPMIDVRKVFITESIVRQFRNIHQCDWIFLTSVNGVVYFFELLQELSIDILPHIKWAVIGKKTKQSLEERGVNVSFIAEEYNGENLAEIFYFFKNKSICIPRAKNGRQAVIDQLKHTGVRELMEIGIYDTIYPRYTKREWMDKQISQSDIWLFTSPSGVENAHMHSQFLNVSISGLIASIGPVTSNKLIELGYDIDIDNRTAPYTVEHMWTAVHKRIHK